MKKIEQAIVNWIRTKVKNARVSGAIIGLSGGIDSAVTSVLVKKALGERTKGLIMPCYSNDQDKKDAILVAEKFKIDYEVVNLEQIYDLFLCYMPPTKERKDTGTKMAEANFKARLRMCTLYFYANKYNYLVVGTDNKTEELTGFFTKWGDGGVDILPIADLYKKDVRKMAKYLGIPKKIITKPPSPGLIAGVNDEDELGLKYEELDEILENIDVAHFEDTPQYDKVIAMIKNSKHKREMPPICKIN